MLFVGDNEPIEKKLAPPLPFRTLVKTFKYDESNDNTVFSFFRIVLFPHTKQFILEKIKKSRKSI